MHKADGSEASCLGERVRVAPIGRDDFPLIEKLFGARGACGGCWCMTWRVPSLGAYWAAHKGEPNRLAFKQLVESGAAHGCLAFADDQPIGWCSAGPREDFAYLKRARLIPQSEEQGIWSLTCFYIAASHQRNGLSALLIEGACRLAREKGARWIEAYPTINRSGGTIPPAFAHTGFPAPFLRLGFSVVAEAGSRLVLRKKVHQRVQEQCSALPV